MRNPIEQVPVYFSEQGVNTAATSLRQIMAEEMAEQIIQEKSNKKSNTTSFTSINNINFSLGASVPSEISKKFETSNSSQDMASLVKIQHLYEKYENLVDKKMIDQIFRNHKLEIVILKVWLTSLLISILI